MKQDFDFKEVLKELQLESVNPGVCTGTTWKQSTGKFIESFSPSDGKLIAGVQQCGVDEYHKVIETAKEAFKKWRMVPAPKRG